MIGKKTLIKKNLNHFIPFRKTKNQIDFFHLDNEKKTGKISIEKYESVNKIQVRGKI